MRIFALSDLHLTISVDKPMEKFGMHWERQMEITKKSCDELLTDDDLLLIGGDISWALKEEDVVKDLEFISSLKGKKVLVRGNHDYWWSTLSKVKRLLPHNVFAVHNSALKFGNIVVGGNRGIQIYEKSSKIEDEKAYETQFQRELGRFDISLAEINKLKKEGDKTILLTHYPPFNLARADSPFTERFENANIDAVVFGHIHLTHLRKKLLEGDFLRFEKNNVKYFLTSSDLLGHIPMEILL